MDNVLFSWIGLTDLKASQNEKNAGIGPIAQAIKGSKFDSIILLTDHSAKENNDFLKWLLKFTKSKVKLVKVNLSSPTNFGDIYENVVKGVKSYLKNNGNLFNVAITRARSQLIVVGDLSECSSCDVDYLAKFAQYTQNLIRQNDEIDQSIKLEYGSSRYPQVDNPEQVSDWEKVFYTELYIAGVKTVPQYRVEKYALDLAIIDGERKLNIEVDGEKYHRNWNGELCHRDQIRNQRMYELGWQVYRFWVYEIRDDLQSCIDKIKKWQAQT